MSCDDPRYMASTWEKSRDLAMHILNKHLVSKHQSYNIPEKIDIHPLLVPVGTFVVVRMDAN